MEIIQTEIVHFYILCNLVRELRSHLPLFFVPMIEIELELLSATDNIDNSEMVSFLYFNILLVEVLRKNESNATFDQKVEASKEISFNCNEFVGFVKSWLKQWANPSYELE